MKSVNLRQIKWSEWVDWYWIDTFSMYIPRVFVHAFHYSHEGEKTVSPAGKNFLTTAFFEGEDGFVYTKHVDIFGKETILPIYRVDDGEEEQSLDVHPVEEHPKPPQRTNIPIKHEKTTDVHGETHSGGDNDKSK